MATTDTKAGFRLPWTSDKSDTAAPADAVAETVVGAPASEPEAVAQETETTDMIDAVPAAPDHEAAVETEAAAEPLTAPEPQAAPEPQTATRKPNKFMADLTKAMQSAAEGAREETLARLAADAKTHIEEIHATSASEATQLRQKADDDVAGVREWSKAEIARIREETDERIAHRKGTLEREIEEHAAYIEARIERVQGRVAAFETEMAAFFERLLAEEDPTRFAALAESLPEPPPLDSLAASTWTPTPGATPDAPPEIVEAAVEPVVAAAEPAVVETEASVSEPEAPPVTADAAIDGGDLFAMVGDAATGAAGAQPDPRLAMLGLPADFAAAEAEAATFDASDDGSSEAGPALADEDIAARLAGLVTPTEGSTGETTTTRVVVTGLVSVASIAGFKRHLSRVPGVASVGVSSGPDGEFVFAVGHGADVALRDVIATLPGFGARVTAEADGELTVAAHDPEVTS